MKSPTRRFYLYAAAMTLAALVAVTVGARLFRGKAIVETPPPNGVIVSKAGGGQFETIGDAIASVKPYMTILVRPGVYREKIIIDRPVEIVGDSNGTNKEIIVENTGGAASWCGPARPSCESYSEEFARVQRCSQQVPKTAKRQRRTVR